MYSIYAFIGLNSVIPEVVYAPSDDPESTSIVSGRAAINDALQKVDFRKIVSVSVGGLTGADTDFRIDKVYLPSSGGYGLKMTISNRKTGQSKEIGTTIYSTNGTWVIESVEFYDGVVTGNEHVKIVVKCLNSESQPIVSLNKSFMALTTLVGGTSFGSEDGKYAITSYNGQSTIAHTVAAASFTDCIDGAGEASFTIPNSHPLYSDLSVIKTHILIKNGTKTVWYGRVFNIKRDFLNRKVITCEGCMSFLNDICLAPYRYYKENPDREKPGEPDYVVDPKTKSDHIDYIMDVYNYRAPATRKVTFSAGHIPEFQTGITVEGCDGYNTVLTEIKNMIGEYNYHLRMIYGLNTSQGRPSLSLSIGKLPSGASTQTIEFGKNLLDFEEFANAESAYGTIIPLGAGDSNCFSDNGKDPLESILPLKDRAYYVAGNTSEYGSIDHIVNFDNISKPDALSDAATAIFKMGGGQPAVEFTIKAVDLHLLNVNVDTFEVGDSVRVKSAPHGIDKDFIITAININILQPESNSYTFSDVNLMTPEDFIDQYYALKIKTDIKLDQKVTAGKGYGIVSMDHDGFDLVLDMTENDESKEDTNG